MTKGEVWRKIRDSDNCNWRSEMDRLTDREVYKTFRKSVGGSWGYDNSFESDLLFQARSNTIRLNVRNRHSGGVVGCELCGGACEDLEHFLFDCPCLENTRDNNLMVGIRGTGDSVETVGKLLFDKSKVKAVKKMLGKLWRVRCSRLGERGALRQIGGDRGSSLCRDRGAVGFGEPRRVVTRALGRLAAQAIAGVG